jgi:hypothetical protein
MWKNTKIWKSEKMNKLFNSLSSGKKEKIRAMVIDYLRAYTHLVMAAARLTPETSRRTFDHLTAASNILKGLREEDFHAANVIEIISDIFSVRKQIERRLAHGKDYFDPLYANTKIRLAQDICILRILKLREK